MEWEVLSKNRRYVIIAVVVLLLSALFPKQSAFPFEFQKGQTWNYKTLYAPFDFPVLKNQAELKETANSQEPREKPFFILLFYQDSVAKRHWRNELAKWETTHSSHNSWKEKGEKIISEAYTKGIYKTWQGINPLIEDSMVFVLEGHVRKERLLTSMRSLQETHAWIEGQWTLLEGPTELLLPLKDAIEPNMRYDRQWTIQWQQQQWFKDPISKDVVHKDDLIVSRNETITAKIYDELISYRNWFHSENTVHGSPWWIWLGYLVTISLIMGMYNLYLVTYLQGVATQMRSLLFLLMWICLFVYVAYGLVHLQGFSPYLIPYCIGPIVIRNFFSERLAFFTHIITVVIVAIITSMPYQWLVLQLLVGIIAVFGTTDTRHWNNFFLSIFRIFLVYSVGYIGISLIQVGDFRQIPWEGLGKIGINVFMTLLAFPFVPLFERLFGFTSSVQLVELSDINRPLLQRLAIEAPGTFQHSLQVGNLGEAAARAVGADALLVKTAALYHDIGKMENPTYFIENVRGPGNPHLDLTPEESAAIILRHVEDGVTLALKEKLPQVVIRFIQTHHGTTTTAYFYKQYINGHEGETVDKALFTYPGPKPETKEETILMMADSIEAASKAMVNPTIEDIDALVDNIINNKAANGQLDESKLTMTELATCRTIFKSLVKSMLHVRIAYPETETRPSF